MAVPDRYVQLPNAFQTARALNPEAGDHAVSADPVALRAAARAVRRSWAKFPYYVRRYGERGRAFSASDSGWLLTLRDLTPDAADRQVRWLGGVLASRGMPRWMLECHLDQLHEELVAVLPDELERHAILAGCAASLRAERRATLDDASFVGIATTFDETVGEPWCRRYRESGGILAAAVIDERCGVVGAVASVESWMVDPSRFPDEWIGAVHIAVASTRAAVR